MFIENSCTRLCCGTDYIPDESLNCKSHHSGEQEEWCDQDVEESERGERLGWTQPVLRVADVCVSNKGLKKRMIHLIRNCNIITIYRL